MDVWLKIKDRGNINQTLRHLNFWLGLFSDKDKYKIWLYNEDVVLPKEYYDNFAIINRKITLEKPNCKKLQSHINNCIITENWKPAGYALCAPYFYLDEKYVWNIDADDITLFGNAKKYIEKAQNFLIDNKLPTLSYDMHFSNHWGNNGKFRKHHWSFGVNISEISKMRDFILKSLYKPIPVAPWGINIDYILDVFLERTNYQYICFTTPYELVHSFGINCEHVFFSKYLQNNKIETSFNGHGVLSEKHYRTVLIQ